MDGDLKNGDIGFGGTVLGVVFIYGGDAFGSVVVFDTDGGEMDD